MKLHAIEHPAAKHHTRRKTPKIAPIIALAALLLTIIPAYYPLLKKYDPKNLSSESSPSYLIIQNPIRQTPPHSIDHHLPRENGLPVPADVERVLPRARSRNVGRKRRSRRRKDVKIRPPPPPPPSHRHRDFMMVPKMSNECDIFSGEWVPNPEAPYYTNLSCWAIQEHQNCMKFGRPDKEFLKWRWKPNGCELPLFDPLQFLELMRGKSIAFVGDSVARNHMQSLICLLSRVEDPIDVSSVPDQQFKRYEYRNYNFTIAIFWSPYLVRTTKTDPDDTTQTRPFNLFLDEFDENWTTQIEDFDYVIISAGHWFFRPTMFYVDRHLVGCQYCPQSNVTHLPMYFSYRRAFRTAFRAINSLKNYKGMTFLRTFAPSHFEGGVWNKGGDCVRTRPFMSNESSLDGYNLELYIIQMKELRIAERVGRKRGLKFRLLDVTQAMLLRPDGHPSTYGHWPQAKVSLYKDCVHWCLPGPIDTWNDFLLQMLKKQASL
ncbi:hypothetical protein F0562_005238 [Nyssa sinensis]|uniref:Uncharacterized protein n=1 Tax=Nyssa sinensis TaxID=561372 RepID=A0A5J5AK19_9ASTE|nr:hypothetical protein F0562_005238 [Nyssa sinensis]